MKFSSEGIGVRVSGQRNSFLAGFVSQALNPMHWLANF